MKMNAMFYGRQLNIIYSNKQFCSISTWAYLQEHVYIELWLVFYRSYLWTSANSAKQKPKTATTADLLMKSDAGYAMIVTIMTFTSE